MAKFIRNPETLGGLANILFGASICTASVATGLVPPGGAAQLSFGAATLMGHFSNRHVKSAEHVLAQVQKRLEQDWRTWMTRAGDTDAGALESAIASVEDVLPNIRLSSAEIVAKRFDAQAMADLLLRKAQEAAPQAYGPGPDTVLARRFLHDLTRQAYGYLTSLPDFTASLAPSLWSDLLGQMDRIETTLTQGQAHQDRRFDALEALLQQALTQGAGQAARQSGVTDAALITLARKIARDVTDPDQAFRELEQAVDIAIAVQTGARGTPDAALKQAAALSAQGAYDDASTTLDTAMAEAEAAHSDRMLRLLQAGLDQDLLRRDSGSAAGRILRIEDIRAGGQATFAALAQAWTGWFIRGRDHGLFLDLDVAADVARHMRDRATDAKESGTAQNYLGVICHIRGEREAGLQGLLKAVAAFEQALTYWTRDQFPVEWAKAKMNLGNSLHALAQRDPGNDRLDRAIRAYHAALCLRTRDAYPADWATTQMNLGTALRTKGETDLEPASVMASLDAFDAALTVRTRAQMPTQWATTTLNCAISLRVIGQMTGNADHFAQALDLFDDIATETLPPYLRAMADFELGLTHLARATLSGAMPDWLDAHHAFDRAIHGFPAEGAPVDRLAATAYDALAQLALGQQTGDEDQIVLARDRLALARSQLSNVGHRNRAGALDRAIADITHDTADDNTAADPVTADMAMPGHAQLHP